MDLDFFLSEHRRATDFVETAGGRAANNSLHDACTRPKIVCNSLHGNVVAALLHRRACAFLAVSVACTIKQESLSTSAYTGVYVTQVF